MAYYCLFDDERQDRLVCRPEVRAADDYVRLWFVRDPFRRLVSFYYQFVVQEQQLWCFADDAKTQRLEASTFVEFVRTVGDLHDKGHRLQHHLEPQTRALLGVPFDRIGRRSLGAASQ